MLGGGFRLTVVLSQVDGVFVCFSELRFTMWKATGAIQHLISHRERANPHLAINILNIEYNSNDKIDSLCN